MIMKNKLVKQLDSLNKGNGPKYLKSAQNAENKTKLQKILTEVADTINQ